MQKTFTMKTGFFNCKSLRGSWGLPSAISKSKWPYAFVGQNNIKVAANRRLLQTYSVLVVQKLRFLKIFNQEKRTAVNQRAFPYDKHWQIFQTVWPLFNLPPVLLTLATNFPPVSTTPVVPEGKFTAAGVIYTDAPWPANISTFEKIRNDTNVIFRGLGEDDSWKTLKQKISWHCPFKIVSQTLQVSCGSCRLCGESENAGLR